MSQESGHSMAMRLKLDLRSEEELFNEFINQEIVDEFKQVVDGFNYNFYTTKKEKYATLEAYKQKK